MEDSHQMYAIETMLFLVGLDVGKKQNKSSFISKLACTYQKFTVLWWVIFMLRVIAKLISSYKLDSSVMKERLIRNFFEGFFFALWYVMMRRRKEITILMHEIEFLARNLNGKINSSWITLATILIFPLALVGSLTVTLPVPEQYCQKMLISQSFGLVNTTESNSCKIWYILGPFDLIPKYVFCTAVCIFYITICLFFRNLLMSHSKLELEKYQLNLNGFRNCLLTYERIVKGLNDFEKVMSLPIFIMVMNDCIGMLLSFMVIDPFDQFSVTGWRRAYIWLNWFTSLRALISLLCVCLVASSVAEASKNAKNVQEEILKRVHTSTMQEKTELLL
ncbi:hypothetical protein AVEN_273114-1, partial [Araneus ventricosus]